MNESFERMNSMHAAGVKATAYPGFFVFNLENMEAKQRDPNQRANINHDFLASVFTFIAVCPFKRAGLNL